MLGVEALADQKDNTGATALHRAVLKKNLPLVKLLVEMGKAHVNVKTKDEGTRIAHWPSSSANCFREQQPVAILPCMRPHLRAMLR
jgi:ankyrin repeat protein